MKFNKTLLSGAFVAALAAGVCGGTINTPTPAPEPTQVQPQLNVAIDKGTDEITFINTNNDPFVYTKVYKLKYADPYEIRPYILSAIRSRRIDANETKVEAIKYADGTGMIIVSAEQYRFKKLENGMTIDQVVTMLDRPNLSAQSGRRFFVYYAKYFDATTLAGLIRQVGIMHADDDMELDGVDTVMPDNGMNALLFFCTPISQKNIEVLLAQYDGPASEALFHYTIYEIEYENDGNVGDDFQAWKNGPGQDLFSAGASYLNSWDSSTSNASKGSSGHANYVNFNPKWNSKYLDFLVSKSKAKVLTSGTLDIWNKGTGTVESVTRFPVIQDGEETVEGEDVVSTTTTTDKNGDKSTATTTTPTSTTQKTAKTRTTTNAEFGFSMTLLPEVYGESTIVKVSMTNTNLIGFNSDGTSRTSRTKLNTTLQVSNSGNTFYIGGLEKSDLVRSVSKVPYLGDIPILGWLFTGENETVKKSQLVAVLTVKPIVPTSEAPGELKKLGAETEKRIKDFGIKSLDENEYGFDQYWLDKDK